MASSLTVKVATYTAQTVFGKTDSQVADILRWFVADKVTPPPAELTPAQLNQYYLDAARDEIVRYVVREAARVRHRELLAQQADIAAQATADAAL